MYTQIVKEDGNLETSDFLFILSGLLIVVMLGAVGVYWKKLPPEIPWFFSMPWGEQQLIEKKYWLAMIGVLGLLMGITRGVASWAGGEDKIVKTTVAGGALLVSILFMATLARVLWIFI